MGSQIAILGTPDDIAEILTVAAGQGARAVPEFILADEPPDLQQPDTLFKADPEKKLYLLPRELEAVEIFTIAGARSDGFERVNDRTSPVVEIVPTRTDGGKMRAGRIYLGLSSSDSRYQDAKRLFDALKKATATWAKAEPGAVRIGPRAAAKAKGGARLESLPGERLALKGKAP